MGIRFLHKCGGGVINGDDFTRHTKAAKEPLKRIAPAQTSVSLHLHGRR